MNKYIVTCSINGREQSALVFDSQRLAANFVQRILKSAGGKIKRSERSQVNWDISRFGTHVSFRQVIADNTDISFVLKNSQQPETQQFRTRLGALKYLSSSLHKVTYVKGLGTGKWQTKKAVLTLILNVRSGQHNSEYELLGVKPGATEAEIKKAYRTKVKSVHPDHGGTEQDMKKLNEAYNNIKSGLSVIDESAQEFYSVTARFLSRKLLSIFSNNAANQQSYRQTSQFELRQITVGVSLIVFSSIVINAGYQTANPKAIYIIAAGILVLGVFYLIRGLVYSFKK